MKCPQCGQVMRTKDTRQWRDIEKRFDWVERRKVCPDCNHRVMTIEMPKDIWAEYSENNLGND
jgi:transcriptional regulator NrdR family protein